MLMKLEANYFYLESQLLNYIKANSPNLLVHIEHWTREINKLPIAERTLYLSILVRNISANHKTQDMNQLLKTQYDFDDKTLKAFEKSIQRFVSEKRNEGN